MKYFTLRDALSDICTDDIFAALGVAVFIICTLFICVGIR